MGQYNIICSMYPEICFQNVIWIDYLRVNQTRTFSEFWILHFGYCRIVLVLWNPHYISSIEASVDWSEFHIRCPHLGYIKWLADIKA